MSETKTQIRIAFDAMGGDFAPDEIVKGAVLACKEYAIEAHLVGTISEITRVLKADGISVPDGVADGSQLSCHGGTVVLHESTEEIDMGEKNPARAVKKAQKSSIVIANKLVADDRADAVVAAGHTGAATATALFEIKRIEGFERPCIVCFIPTVTGVMLLIDAGSNIESSPEQIYQNALIANVLGKGLLGADSPRLGLLNIGGEPGKGTDLYKRSYELIEQNKDFNFVGNVEGKTIVYDNCDVAICDGFVGNIHLKALEGGLKMFEEVLKNEAKKSLIGKLAGLALKSIGVFEHIKNHFHPSSYGGAILGGINGVVIIAHGSSDARAIKNSARQAIRAVQADVIKQQRESI